MKKALLIYSTLLILVAMTACKSGTNKVFIVTNEITWDSIAHKLNDKVPLSNNDCLFILTDTTFGLGDYPTEGIGYNLFNLLKENPQANELFLIATKGFSKEECDKNLQNLMNLMAIDIAFEYEQYEDFLNDFPLFSKCDGIEELFYTIKANGI